MLTLTAKGRELHDKVMPLTNDFHNQLRSALTQEENEKLYEILNRLMSRACSLRGGDFV